MYPRRSARLLAKNNKVPPDTDVVMKEESPGMEAEETRKWRLRWCWFVP
jgi:hypothetical protein